MSVTYNFEGKVALVTGASSGIGRATAEQFARAGARVAVSDVAVEGGEETVRRITQEGGEATFVRCDVSNGARVQELIRQTLVTYGHLDMAVNNAGIEGTLAATDQMSEESWNRVLSINLTGVWLCMKYELEPMLRQGGGAIVNMASILGVVGFASAGAYVAAKHGVIGITQTAALEYAERGIRVNAICPAFIETPMVMDRGLGARTHPEVYQQVAALHPVKRLGTPGEVAGAVLWLCSDAASFVTGDAVLVDGGYTAQ
jgi:NAD(P)-dependent dehydrogenase (short-subunit alcohol dehydrogenase family)